MLWQDEALILDFHDFIELTLALGLALGLALTLTLTLTLKLTLALTLTLTLTLTSRSQTFTQILRTSERHFFGVPIFFVYLCITNQKNKLKTINIYETAKQTVRA
jgi:hypothetical protein